MLLGNYNVKDNFVVFSKRWLSILLCSASSLVSAYATADIYSGIAFGYTNAESDSATSSQSGHPILMQMQLGHFFNDYIALEGRYGQSLERSGGVAVDDLASLFIKGNVPVSEQTAIYALAGYTYNALNLSSNQTVSDSDISFGIGVHYALDNKAAITAELLNYTTADETRLSGLNIGYQFRF